MCDFGAMSAGLGIGGQLLNFQGERANAKAIGLAKQQEATNIIKASNYDYQNYEAERTDAYDAAVQEIMKVRHNALGLSAGVEAAITEDMGEGRTASLINRSVAGDEARAVSSVQENYDRKSNEIDLNKERVLIQTKATLSGIKAPKGPSFLPTLLNIGAIGLNAYTGYASRKADAIADGADYGTDGAKTKK